MSYDPDTKIKGREALEPEDLEMVTGGCSVSVDGERYTMVTANTYCMKKSWERREQKLDMNNITPFDAWYNLSSDFQCGTCVHLRFEGKIGYCGLER